MAGDFILCWISVNNEIFKITSFKPEGTTSKHKHLFIIIFSANMIPEQFPSQKVKGSN